MAARRKSNRGKRTKRARRPVRPEDIYDFTRVRDPRVSLDGRLVAWVETTVDRPADRNVDAIWIASLDGRKPPRGFIRGHPAASPRWSPDGSELAFVSNRGEGSQVYLASIEGGDPRQLTRGKASATACDF